MSTIEKTKDKVRAAIRDGQRPGTLATLAGLHRNALYGCLYPNWNPSSDTLKKLERVL